MHSNKMTSTEKRAIFSLSTIMSLRMIGLFMVLPVFTLYAQQLRGSTPTLIGLAVGIYGLSQAIFQIPFGALSDRFGRKPIIIIGLFIFALGSLLAASAHSIVLMIIGRALQGIGAVGSTILALISDLTREEQRTKAMAIAGISIGFSFSLAMFIGPVLTQWMSVSNLFLIATAMGFLGILILYISVPSPTTSQWQRSVKPHSFLALLTSPDLAKLNIGIFILHALFTASFVIIPINLYQSAGLAASKQWMIYLPALLSAFVMSLICIGIAESKRLVKPFFLSSIITLGFAELVLWYAAGNLLLNAFGLCLFFGAFSILEAFMPSLISRTAPAANKGSALGIYSCSQFFGIFVGGFLGGWLYGKFGFSSVYLLCIGLSFSWLVIAYFMQPPRYLVTQMWKILPSQQETWHAIAKQLQAIPGIVEIAYIAEEGMAYLKVERESAKHPDFLHLKEQLQSE